jgi:hypothetical protein
MFFDSALFFFLDSDTCSWTFLPEHVACRYGIVLY